VGDGGGRAWAFEGGGMRKWGADAEGDADDAAADDDDAAAAAAAAAAAGCGGVQPKAKSVSMALGNRLKELLTSDSLITPSLV